MAIVLNNVTSGYNLSTINSNFQKIEDYVNDKLLARADTGVAGEAMMERALDMNGNKILNVFVDVNDASSLLTVGVADSRYYNVSGDTLTGPMNANSQIISNLPSPTQASQPATKAYADAIQSDVDSNESRSLRFPDTIEAMVGAPSRANSLQGYNNLGAPVPVFSYTDTADLALKLASTTGTDYVSHGNTPLSTLVKGNIFEYITANDRNTLLTSLGGEVIVDYALQAAIDDGVTFLECPPVPGIYVFGKNLVTLPVGFSLEGKSRKMTTTNSDSSFYNVGTVFRLFKGAPTLFKLTARHTFRQIVFDGRDKSVRLTQGDDQTQYCRFIDCGIHRWSVGIGQSSPNGYTATLLVSGGTISSNYIGVKNVIDSAFLGVAIGSNDSHGVHLLTGSNNNSFVGGRNEWNGGCAYYGYGCKRILIQGDLLDRSGTNAVAAVAGAQFILSDVAVQRSGRLATEGSVDDAHFYIEGDGSSIIQTAVYTTTGSNDDGSGRASPTYLLATGGGASNSKSFIASASNLSGYSGTSWLRSGSVKALSVIGCEGVEDVKNFGLRRISDGVQYLGDTVNGIGLSGAGNTATMTFTTNPQELSRYSSAFLVRTLEITARNNTSTGAVAYYSVNLIISREQASAAIAVDTASVRTFATASSGTWGIPSASPTGVSLAFSVSADGTTLTVTLTAIDSASRAISAKLRA